MSKIESAISWMETTANDNSHGYDQKYRWGSKGDYDCSSAVITAWELAGVPVKTNGATYTGNMLSVFKKCGFTDVTSSVNLKTGEGLVRGDVLLNRAKHVAMYCGNGKEVEASINEKGKAIGGVPGDQTGKEFLIRSYRNYPWNNVLRYSEAVTEVTKVTTSTETVTSEEKARYSADNFDKSIAKTYHTTANLNIRHGAGTNYKALAVLPKGTAVTCYGYYSTSKGVKWYYVQATVGTVRYTGFCSSQYLG